MSMNSVSNNFTIERSTLQVAETKKKGLASLKKIHTVLSLMMCISLRRVCWELCMCYRSVTELKKLLNGDPMFRLF
jgi:hypothetical protein